jgi:DNA-binding CsgD family transcriptional regulator
MVDRLQAGQIVVGEGDAPRAQRGHRGGDVGNAPAQRGVGRARALGARKEGDLGAAAAEDELALSVCDLVSGRRHVTGWPPSVIGADERAAFDRHFRDHPLVRYHSVERGVYTHRISDSVAWPRFRESALYNDYYRRVGITHAVAVPVYASDALLVSFVLNRDRIDFSDREIARLDAARPALARLYREQRVAPDVLRLTPREREVLRWVGAGKTDRDIAAILGCSPRTIHKHLQRIYVTLGVETRTAAAMRWHGLG